MIPRVVHFVFGLEEQSEPFHFAHYLAVESCRRVLEPESILFHHKHRPWGKLWDRLEPHLALVEVDLVEDVLEADYSRGQVPPSLRYAHHADFIRLDALIDHGGIYADIDTVFVRTFPPELFEAPFVIGAEPDVRDTITGELRPSLCNALLMAEPASRFARTWRERMAGALNGTWSNHSGFLAAELAAEMPDDVHVEPEARFFSFAGDSKGIAQIFEERHAVSEEALSIHLWAHLWWKRGRRDFSSANAKWCSPSGLRRARTTLADLARPYIPELDSSSQAAADAWIYLSLDESSGYGVAADRCIAALEDVGLQVDWTPFVPGNGWGYSYQPPEQLDPMEGVEPGQVVVAHLVPEFFPRVRERSPEAFVVGHTVWETDRIPKHWLTCLESTDLLVVPSSFSAQAIASSPVQTPVAIVPHAAPPLVEGGSHLWDAIDRDVFVFYTIAEWNERKGVSKTIEAYLRAFKATDRVLLVVKTSHLDYRLPPQAPSKGLHPGGTALSLARLLSSHHQPPQVVLITKALNDDDISTLHRRGNCFVSLCRSEGFGLGTFDAAANGTPVVTTGFGGQLEYLGGWPYLVGFDIVSVDNPVGYQSYSPDQHWAEPDVDHGAALLREVFADHEHASEMASVLAADINWNYRPDAIANAFVSAVEAHRPRQSLDTEVRAPTASHPH